MFRSTYYIFDPHTATYVGTSYVYNLCVLFLWQMSRFGKSLHQWWDEDDESDDDDLLILAGLIEGSKRNKQKNFRGSLLGRHSVRTGILGGHEGIFRDYFVDPCIYNDKHFRRRFRDYF